MRRTGDRNAEPAAAADAINRAAEPRRQTTDVKSVLFAADNRGGHLMIKIPRRTVALVGASGAFLLAVDPPANGAAAMDAESPQDRREIEAICEGLVKTWNAHDMDAFAALFHDDAAWVHWRGGYWKGRAEIKEGHAAVHRTFYRTSQATSRGVEDLTFFTPEVALAHFRDDLAGDERSPGQTFRYRMTLILTKRDGGWRIAAGHNTRMHDDIQ